MNDLVIACAGVAFQTILPRRCGRWHPARLFLYLWTALPIIHALLPLGLSPTSLRASLVIGVGLAGFTLGARSHGHAVSRTWAAVSPRKPRVIAWVVALCLGVAVGLLQFRKLVESSVGAADFDTLDPTTIRYAITAGTARGGGIGALLFSLAPVLACLGVLAGARLNRAWYVLVALALAVTTQSPGRTQTLSLVFTAVPFYFYVRTRRLGRRPVRGRVVMLVGAALGGSLWYFNHVGSQLGKSQSLSRLFPNFPAPDILLSPIVYELGGLSAFSVAQSATGSPVAGEEGRSVYALLRLAQAVGLPIHAPETIAGWVSIPIPFNVYTGFGDVWFDFGSIGVFLFFLCMGRLLSAGHAGAQRMDLRWVWVTSALMSVMASTPISIRLFYLDTTLQLVVGVLVFGSLQAAPASDGETLEITPHGDRDTTAVRAQADRGGPVHTDVRIHDGSSQQL